MDMQQGIIGVDNLEVEKTSAIITDPADIGAVIEALRSVNLIGLDTETTGLDYMRAQLHGISVATESASWYVCNGALLPFTAELRRLMSEHPDTLWCGHNLKYDLHFLKRYDCLPARIADTMVAQWLVDENMELGLKRLAVTRLGYREEDLPEYKDLLKEAKDRINTAISAEAKKIKDPVERKKLLATKVKLDDLTIYDLPLEKVGEYAARDARLTYDLWKKEIFDLVAEGLDTYYWEIEMPFLWVLFEMEENGMYVDGGRINELETQWKAKAEEAKAKWDALSGGVNPASTVQLGQYLFIKLGLPEQGKTGKGKPSVDALVLQRLEPLDTTGAVAALREWRKYEKLLSTYITFLHEKPVAGRVHGNFNATGTVTGRLSSSDPNLQNIPTRSDIGHLMRYVFSSEPGNKLICVDYSQIELRLLTHYSKDENFMKVFAEKGDPHQMTADLAHVERHIGKTLNFAWAYGAGPRKLCDTIEKDENPRPAESDAREWLDNFNRAYPALGKWKANVLKRARQLGYILTIGGRKRHLPDLNNYDNDLRATAERQCVNSIIQGSASDVLKWAMVELKPWLDFYGARLLAQVHDELLVEVKEEHAEELANVIQRVMESVEKQFSLRVPIIAEPGIGDTWAQAK